MMLHPATAHFAIALPLVASVLGAIYFANRDNKLARSLSTFAIVVTAVAIGVAWFSGNQAGPKVFEFLSAEGKEELLEHKTFGLYLAVAMGVIAVLKVIGCKLNKFALEAVAIAATFVMTIAVLLQGKEGGEIVYEHAQPFKAALIKETIKDAAASAEDAEECDEKIEIFEDAVDSIDEIDANVNEALGIKSEAKEEEEDDDE